MGLAYFMLQSLRNVRFRRRKKKKEVFTWCDTSNFLKEKYPVLFMESWGCFVVAAVSCELFYRSAWRFPLESGRQCLDTENISIGDESSREDGTHSQTCRDRDWSSSGLCFP